MKITSTSLIFSLFSFLSFGQWTNGGTISEKFGNTSNGLLTTQWKSIGIGEKGAAMTARFRNSVQAGTTIGQFVGREKLMDILGQENCVGIRFYYALNELNEPAIVAVGADSDENDLTEGIIIDHFKKCPPMCSQKNKLNS